jgi:hypothetical protein
VNLPSVHIAYSIHNLLLRITVLAHDAIVYLIVVFGICMLQPSILCRLGLRPFDCFMIDVSYLVGFDFSRSLLSSSFLGARRLITYSRYTNLCYDNRRKHRLQKL